MDVALAAAALARWRCGVGKAVGEAGKAVMDAALLTYG
jgi:hypothetical protein